MLLDTRNYYKPLDYEWAFNAFELHEKLHWLPSEVPLEQDVKDWDFKLSDQERNLLTNLFRFFTQADVDVAAGYTQKFLPLFGGNPEIAMMMSSFAAREAVHIHAYSLLIDTIGMPETEYQAFHEYKEMAEKHEYIAEFQPNLNDKQSIAEAIAVYSGFTEGMQLFSSFIILMNFAVHGKMKGMDKIVQWSVRDESLHVAAMIQLFKTFCREYSSEINLEELEKSVTRIAVKMVQLEDQFIKLAFDQGDIEGLNPRLVEEYIRWIADRRLTQLGFQPFWNLSENPLPEALIAKMNAPEHTNFFENRATDYSKGNIKGKITNWG